MSNLSDYLEDPQAWFNEEYERYQRRKALIEANAEVSAEKFQADYERRLEDLEQAWIQAQEDAYHDAVEYGIIKQGDDPPWSYREYHVGVVRDIIDVQEREREEEMARRRERSMRLAPSALVGQQVESVAIDEEGRPEVIHTEKYTVLIGCNLAGENLSAVYPRLKKCPTCGGEGPPSCCPDCIWGLGGWTLDEGEVSDG